MSMTQPDFDPSKYGDFSGQASLLSTSLSVAVPLWIMQLDELRKTLDPDDFARHLSDRAGVCSRVVAETGDYLMFRGEGKQKGKSAEVFNRLAEGVACMAFCPGGITAFGSHWEHATGDDVPKTVLPCVVVFGSRTYRDYELLCAKLDLYTADLGKIVVVHGVASGADTLAEKWAFARGHNVLRFHADWDAHGKAAGPIRNQEMIDHVLTVPDRFAVAFWDGKSAGTEDTITRCRKHGIPLKVIRF